MVATYYRFRPSCEIPSIVGAPICGDCVNCSKYVHERYSERIFGELHCDGMAQSAWV